MENLVLYRKYRPKTFSEVVGQEHVVQTLTNAIAAEMVSHAYLFSGPRGSGKTTIARLLAKAVNCERRHGYEPCNKCSSCVEISQARAIDLIEIDAASNRGIDEIRDLRDGIRFAPTKSKYKVFIIDESHQLTKEAANALLKTLEEPPKHAIFILATTEIHKMIPTIISRCQRFDFRKLTLLEIVGKLEIICKKEKIKIEKSALEMLALNAGGALRDAEGFLDQAITFSIGPANREITAEAIKDLLGITDINLVSQFCDLLCEKNSGKAISFLNQALEKGQDPQQFAKALTRYLRQVLLFKINPEMTDLVLSGLTLEARQKVQVQAEGLDQEELHRTLRLFLDAENKMKYASIPQLPLELAIIEALSPITNN